MWEYLALICSLILLLSMLLFLELGRRYGLKQTAEAAAAGTTGKRIVEGSFFGLLSLLIAFSFNGAVSRFDHRRQLIIEESNNIEAAYFKVDLLPPEVQPQMRDLFRQYLDHRLAIYKAIPDLDAAYRELALSKEAQEQIWKLAIESTPKPGAHPNAGVIVINSLTPMFDIANERIWIAFTHPPSLIYGLLFAIALICSFIAGNSMADERKHTWTHVLGFALLTCVSVFVVLEIEFPRVGFIGLDKYDQALVEVRKSMDRTPSSEP